MLRSPGGLDVKAEGHITAVCYNMPVLVPTSQTNELIQQVSSCLLELVSHP